ncbi:MAG: glycoside hydrolase family 16 protein [Acutalibacteraceae bacterium]|nr:glycoside hydrolase family 16 protein [Acutalibacteraceae bacterium]
MAVLFSKIIRILVSALMAISPTLPHMFSLPAIPQGQELKLDSRFELVWSDEFEGDKLDKSKWNTNWWEIERKGGYWHDDMVKVENGNLVITTAYYENGLEIPDKYKNYFSTRPHKEYKEGWYTGCVTGQGNQNFLYGYYECRAILPKSTGMWSAFWMMNKNVEKVDGSGKDGTEVDIFESMYYKDVSWGAGDAIVSGIHYDGYGEDHKGDSIGKWFANNPYEEYNTYGLEWTPEEYIFYINGVETGRLSTGGVSQNPEYLILSCEVAGANGIADADRNGTGEMSMEPGDTAEFIVDYVRVYKHK